MPAVKSYKIEHKGNCVAIRWEGGGQLPEALGGLYTSVLEAEKAINVYEKNKKQNKAERTVKPPKEED